MPEILIKATGGEAHIGYISVDFTEARPVGDNTCLPLGTGDHIVIFQRDANTAEAIFREYAFDLRRATACRSFTDRLYFLPVAVEKIIERDILCFTIPTRGDGTLAGHAKCHIEMKRKASGEKKCV